MRIREETDARVTPEKAWELIADPSLHALWNSHIVGTVISSGNAPQRGFRYRVTYELKGNRTEFDAEITEFDPPHRLGVRLEERFKGDGKNWDRFMEESYTLTPRGDQTHVLHDVRINHSGVPLLLRFLIWFIMTTGKPVGPTFMERFRELAESEVAKPAAHGA